MMVSVLASVEMLARHSECHSERQMADCLAAQEAALWALQMVYYLVERLVLLMAVLMVS